MMRGLRFVSLLIGALLCVLVGAGLSVASVENSAWDLQLKVRGTAAKVGALKADGPNKLYFQTNGFILAHTNIVGTYADEGGKLVFVPTDGLTGFIRAVIEVSAESRGKDAAVSSVAITKFSSTGSSEKQSWADQKLTLAWKVSFTFNGVVDGKTLINAKGSLSFSGKGVDTGRGVGSSLAGSAWHLVLKESISASGAGSDSWVDEATLTFGPALGLPANRFESEWASGSLTGSYTVTAKGISFVFDESDLRNFLEYEVTSLLEHGGSYVDSINLTKISQMASATVVGGKMTIGGTFAFSGYADVDGHTSSGSGSYTAKGTGTRL